jgi:hypothetical protein
MRYTSGKSGSKLEREGSGFIFWRGAVWFFFMQGSLLRWLKNLVGNHHVQQVLGLKEYWGKLWYVWILDYGHLFLVK